MKSPCLHRVTIEGYTDTFTVTKGAKTVVVDELELDHILDFVRDLPAGNRLKTLKNMRVQMFSARPPRNPPAVRSRLTGG